LPPVPSIARSEAAMRHHRLHHAIVPVLGMILLNASPKKSATAIAPDSVPALPPPAERTIDYRREILPIFEANCYACQGPTKQKSDLRLDRRAPALRGGAEGPDIVPGHSADSPLIERVAGIDPDAVMPPEGKRLTAEQVAILRAWIDQGAHWPEDKVTPDRG